ncbi:MAG: hypothetical protein IJ666_06380 [Ruminococcus sp.]|nr:hypothetical protein [Ruminococcus sp.]
MNNIKKFIDGLEINDIPWGRMITAYGTAENYPEYLEILDSMQNIEEMDKALDGLSEFEHQSTMFPPAPFALVFLARTYRKALNTDTPEAEWLVNELKNSFDYYNEVCEDAESMEHAEPLQNFQDMLDRKYLLSEEPDEEELEEVFENFIPDDLFYSLYYYSGMIISDILGKN